MSVLRSIASGFVPRSIAAGARPLESCEIRVELPRQHPHVACLDDTEAPFHPLEVSFRFLQLRFDELVGVEGLSRAVSGSLFDEEGSEARCHLLRTLGVGVGVFDDERLFAAKPDSGAASDHVDDFRARLVGQFGVGVQIVEDALDSWPGEDLFVDGSEPVARVLGGDPRDEAVGYRISFDENDGPGDVALGDESHNYLRADRAQYETDNDPIPAEAENVEVLSGCLRQVDWKLELVAIRLAPRHRLVLSARILLPNID